MDPSYITIYVHWFLMFVTGVIPISCLVFLNASIYAKILETRRLRERCRIRSSTVIGNKICNQLFNLKALRLSLFSSSKPETRLEPRLDQPPAAAPRASQSIHRHQQRADHATFRIELTRATSPNSVSIPIPRSSSSLPRSQTRVHVDQRHQDGSRPPQHCDGVFHLPPT